MWRSALVLGVMVAGVATAQESSPSGTAGNGDPAIRVTLNSNNVYDRGDRGRVFVKVRDDGYVIVLQATPDGRIRPLYPADPTGENRFGGGANFEVLSRDEHEAFQVTETRGNGVIYAAYSQEPFKFDDFMRGGHWDLDAFPDSGVRGNEEAVMTDLVQHMATGAHFDYDLAAYRVAPPFHRHDEYAYGDRDDQPYYYPPPVVLATYGASPWWWGPTYYSPFYDPFFYDPFFYRPGFAFGFGYGWGGWGGGCWGCGYGGYAVYRTGPGVYGRPGWGVGTGVGYRGRFALASGHSLGAAPGIGYRNRVGGAVFTNVGLGRRTVLPQVMANRAVATPNQGRAIYRTAPGLAEPGRAVPNRVPSVAPVGGSYGAGGAVGGARTSMPNGAMGRAPMPVPRRVEPSMSMPSGQSGGGGQVHSGGGGVAAPRAAPRAAPPSAPPRSGGGGGGGGGGGHHMSVGGGHSGGGGGHGGGGHHR